MGVDDWVRKGDSVADGAESWLYTSSQDGVEADRVQMDEIVSSTPTVVSRLL